MVLLNQDVICVNASQWYFSCKICSYNISIYNLIIYMETKQTGNSVWCETEGKCGSCEIGSILYKYIFHFNPVLHIFVSTLEKWSGQNHNKYHVSTPLLCSHHFTILLLYSHHLTILLLYSHHVSTPLLYSHHLTILLYIKWNSDMVLYKIKQ